MNLLVPLVQPSVSTTAPVSALGPEALLQEGRRQGASELTEDDKSTTQTEQPWHTLAAKSIASGLTPKETAEFCSVAVVQIYRLLRVPWFQERVAQFMETQGQDVLSLFKASAVSAYATLVEICEDADAPKMARISSAKEILERVLGKSTQSIEVSAKPPSDPVAEAEQLKLQIAQLRGTAS